MGCVFTKNEDFGLGFIERDHKYKVIHQPRPGKKLLVLDLDQTLCDLHPKKHLLPRERPHLHYFLEEMYKMFDIIIWSATVISVVKNKLIWLGVLRNPRYNIMCYIGEKAMTTIRFRSDRVIRTKCLEVIWNKFPEYNARNTIIVDDKKKNFYMNSKNGILIKRFEAGDYQTDEELFLLITYLTNICIFSPNFMVMNHKQWKKNIKSYY